MASADVTGEQGELLAALDAVADGVMIHDAHGHRLYANEHAALAAGYPDGPTYVLASPQELAERFEFFDEDGRTMTADRWPPVVAARLGGPVEVVMGFRARGSHEARWSRVRSRPVIEGGQVVKVITAWHDTTAEVRRRREATILAEVTAELAAAETSAARAEALAQAVVPRLASVCRVTVEGGGVALRHDGDPAALLDGEHAARVPLMARGHAVGELALARRGGFDAPALLFVRELASRAALLLDNARLLAEARRAVELRDDVLAVVTHDMKSPLGAILFTASLLARGAGDGGSWERVRRGAESIVSAAETLDRAMRDLGDVAALEAGKLSVLIGDEAAGPLVREAVTLFEPLAVARAVSLRAGGGDASFAVRCDRGRVLQVLGNLISNAVRHAADGGAVTVDVRRDGQRAVFSVTDDGEGIPAELLGKLFSERPAGRPTRRGPGGIGLTIADGLVRAHGGRMWAERPAAHGTRVSFSIPLAETR